MSDCPHIITDHEGTSYCSLAQSTSENVSALIAERDKLRQLVGDGLRLPSAKDVEIARLRTALENARPLIKMAVNGSSAADRVLDEIAEVLDHAANASQSEAATNQPLPSQ